MWTFIIVFTLVFALLSKYGGRRAQTALMAAVLAALPTAAAYPNIPVPLTTNDIPLTEAGIAAILAYMGKFASDATSDVKKYLGFDSSLDGHPGQWMSSTVQGRLEEFAQFLRGTASPATTAMWNTADHADVFTARSPFTTGAQRQAVLSLWKRIQAGKDALLSVEKTVLITGEKLAEAIASLKPFLELTELQNYRNIANI